MSSSRSRNEKSSSTSGAEPYLRRSVRIAESEQAQYARIQQSSRQMRPPARPRPRIRVRANPRLDTATHCTRNLRSRNFQQNEPFPSCSRSSARRNYTETSSSTATDIYARPGRRSRTTYPRGGASVVTTRSKSTTSMNLRITTLQRGSVVYRNVTTAEKPTFVPSRIQFPEASTSRSKSIDIKHVSMSTSPGEQFSPKVPARRFARRFKSGAIISSQRSVLSQSVHSQSSLSQSSSVDTATTPEGNIAKLLQSPLRSDEFQEHDQESWPGVSREIRSTIELHNLDDDSIDLSRRRRLLSRRERSIRYHLRRQRDGRSSSSESEVVIAKARNPRRIQHFIRR